MKLDINFVFTLLVFMLVFSGFYSGYGEGFISKLISLLSIFLSFFITKTFGSMVLNMCGISSKQIISAVAHINLPSDVYQKIDKFIILIASYLALKLVAKALSSINFIPLVGSLNRLLGGVLGSVENILKLIIVINLLSNFTYIDSVNKIVSAANSLPLFSIDLIKFIKF